MKGGKIVWWVRPRKGRAKTIGQKQREGGREGGKEDGSTSFYDCIIHHSQVHHDAAVSDDPTAKAHPQG